MESPNQDPPPPPPWGDLCTDMLSEIAQRISSSREYGAMCCVNRHWNSSLKSTLFPIHILPRLPFLVLPPKPSASNPPPPEINAVVCIRRGTKEGAADQVASHLTLPNLTATKGKVTIGSGNGWLIILDENSGISLLNLLKATTISLPPLSSIDPSYLQFHRDGTPPYNIPVTNRGYTQKTLIHRAVLSSDPEAEADNDEKLEKLQVMMYFKDLTSCCFTCTGKSNAWTCHPHKPLVIEDLVFYQDRFWVIDLSWVLTSFKLAEDDTLLVTSQHIANDDIPFQVGYLAISGTDLILVIKNRRRNPEGVRLRRSLSARVKISLYKVVKNGVVVNEAEQISSLPGMALFVGHGCSVCVKTDDLNRLQDNTAYFYNARHFVGDREFDQGRVGRQYKATIFTYSVPSRVYSEYLSINSFVEEEVAYKQVETDAQTFWVAPNFAHIKGIESAAMPISPMRAVFQMLSSSRYTKFVLTAVVGVVAFKMMDQWLKKRG